MHTLYETASEITDKLKEARLQVVQLSAELSRAEYDLRLFQARVERGLIKKMGGEKALAPTDKARARIFTLALDADENYKAQLKRRNAIELQLEEAKVEVATLRDKLNLMLTAMRITGDSD